MSPSDFVELRAHLFSTFERLLHGCRASSVDLVYQYHKIAFRTYASIVMFPNVMKHLGNLYDSDFGFYDEEK